MKNILDLFEDKIEVDLYNNIIESIILYNDGQSITIEVADSLIQAYIWLHEEKPTISNQINVKTQLVKEGKIIDQVRPQNVLDTIKEAVANGKIVDGFTTEDRNKLQRKNFKRDGVIDWSKQ